jgi:tetratricopeptide (TPR) repeat protein
MSDADDARELLDRGRAALFERRQGDAIAAHRELVERYGARDDLELDQLVGHALHGIALNLELIEREDEALATYDQIVERYSEAQDRELRGHLGRALVGRGLLMDSMGQHEGAIGVWDRVIARFDADDSFLGLAMTARERKASTLRRLERNDEALALYDEVLLRVADSDSRELRRHADVALSNKAFVLMLQHRLDEAIVVADATVARLDEADRPADLAIAVLNLGGALVSEGRLEEALEVYDALVERLDANPTPAVLEHLIVAASNEVEVLGMLGRIEDAAAVHAQLLERYGEDVPRALGQAARRNERDEGAAPVVAGLLLKQAMVLIQLGHADDALTRVNDLIQRFGDETAEEMTRVIGIARDLREQLEEEV